MSHEDHKASKQKINKGQDEPATDGHGSDDGELLEDELEVVAGGATKGIEPKIVALVDPNENKKKPAS